MTRADSLDDAVSPRRAAKARVVAHEFAAFCSRFDLDDTSEAVTLFLTTLVDEGVPARAIRERLQLLDLDRRLRGHKPWHQDPDVRTFLRGLFSDRPVGERHNHYDPLYLELAHAMVDACRTPTDDQRRALAALILQDRLALTTASLARLRWSDLRLFKGRVEIDVTTKVGRGAAITSTKTLPTRPGSSDCPVAAVRALRGLGGGEFVFGAHGRPIDINRLARLLAAGKTGTSAPGQVRDAALILVGYAAGLRTSEAMTLRVGDVTRHDKGLVLSLRGRRRLTFLSSTPDPAYDPAVAWRAWVNLLRAHGRPLPDGLAFRATHFSVVFEQGLRESGLNRIVHQRAEEAGLNGRFVWTSLRTGMMRTAIRNDVRSYQIAAHADLATLGSVARHERRETLLGEANVARRLGL